MWCTQCSVFSTATCRQKQHALRGSVEVLKENMELIEGRVMKCCSMWDKAIEDRQRVHQYYDDILNSLRLVQVFLWCSFTSLKMVSTVVACRMTSWTELKWMTATLRWWRAENKSLVNCVLLLIYTTLKTTSCVPWQKQKMPSNSKGYIDFVLILFNNMFS